VVNNDEHSLGMHRVPKKKTMLECLFGKCEI
jgi:hypothetical protein